MMHPLVIERKIIFQIGSYEHCWSPFTGVALSIGWRYTGFQLPVRYGFTGTRPNTWRLTDKTGTFHPCLRGMAGPSHENVRLFFYTHHAGSGTMQENKTFIIEIDSSHPNQDAHDLAERIASSDADVRSHLSTESLDTLRSLTTARIELHLAAAGVASLAHALLFWLKAKPSSTQVTVHTDSETYQIGPGEAKDTDRFIEFLRSALASSDSYSGVSSPPRPWP